MPLCPRIRSQGPGSDPAEGMRGEQGRAGIQCRCHGMLNRVSQCSPGYPGTPYVKQAALELPEEVCGPLPPESWD